MSTESMDAEFAKLVERARRADRGDRGCAHCSETGGQFQWVTYRGAPDGGVPVHYKCVPAYFEAMDKRPYRY